MQTLRFRTVARLASKPPTMAERERDRYQLGRKDALAGRSRRNFLVRNDDEAELEDEYRRGYARSPATK